MEPEKISTICHCKQEAVALILEDSTSRVIWCAAGHVTVTHDDFVMKVYDFSKS